MAPPVPSSDPIDDEVGGLQDDGMRRAYAEPAVLSWDDDSDDELLLDADLPLRRQPRRAAARTAPYTFRPSLVREEPDTRFSIEALCREKKRPRRRVDVDVAVELPNTEAPDSVWQLLARDAQERKLKTSTYWDHEMNPATDVHTGASLAQHIDTLAPLDLIQVALADDEYAARAARNRLAHVEQVWVYVPVILASLGHGASEGTLGWAPPRERRVHRLWHMLQCLPDPCDAQTWTMLLHLGTAPPMQAFPYERASLLRPLLSHMDLDELGACIVDLGKTLEAEDRVALVRAIPGLGDVRALVAYHLLLSLSWPSPLDIPRLSAWLATIHTPGDYASATAHMELLSLALSNAPALLAARGSDALCELCPLVQRVWTLCRAWYDPRGHTDKMAARDVAQRLGWRLSYQARNYVEKSHEQAWSLQPLLDGIMPSSVY